jgi:hypothetical protein
MRKGLLLIMVLLVYGLAGQAQTVSRLKSWGFLDLPPSPVKSFSTAIGGFQMDFVWPNTQLYKVNADGTRTILSKLRRSIGAKSFQFLESDKQVMFAYSENDSVFFYLTDGTAAKTKLVYTYKGPSSTHVYDFTFHKGKAYIVYDIGYHYFQGMVEINPDDYTSKVIFNKGTEDLGLYSDLKLWSVISNDESLLVNYLTGGVNYAFQVNPVDGSLTKVSDKLNVWTPQNPFVLLGKTLAAFTLEEVRVFMNGSNFLTNRMVLSKYNDASKTFVHLWYVGYVQAEQPSYLGEINGKHYFFSNGDYNVTNCNTVNCSGNFGAYLWEVDETGARLMKSVAEAGEKSYTYAGIKQVASDKIYLEITTKAAGKELWVATPNDLYLLKDHIGSPTVLRDYGLKLDEAAVCGGNIAIPGVGAMAQTGNDHELYVSDGTVGNLNKIDVMPKTGVQSFPKGLVNVADKILFVAADTLKDNLGIAMNSMYSIDLCNAGTTAVPKPSVSIGELMVFPNPAKNILTIQSTDEVAYIEIYSITGTLVFKEFNPEKQIDVSQLKNGLYLIRAQTSKKLLTTRVQVQR